MEGTVRALSAGTRDAVLAHCRRVVEHVARAHGLEATLTVEEGYPSTVNDAEMAAFALDAARAAVDPGRVEEIRDPVMGAEDFSYVLQRVPGAMLRLGTAAPGVEHPAPNHSNRMILFEPAMAEGVAVYAALALRYLDGSR
jgi:hippurate hydrolase